MIVSVCIADDTAIEVTLISPESTVRAGNAAVDLEGLVSDLGVVEMRLLVNSQAERFVKVEKGYFRDTVRLEQRDNRIMFFGVNQQRKQFRAEFTVVNEVFREKSAEEKLPPMLEVSGLTPGKFAILSPRTYSGLELTAWDNQGPIVQVGYVYNGGTTVYLNLGDNGKAPLNLSRALERKSQSLHVFAIDSDGNRSAVNYHFRVEEMQCQLEVFPTLGIMNQTSIFLSASTKGGTDPVSKHFSLVAENGVIVSELTTSEDQVKLQISDSYGKLKAKGRLLLKDRNGIEAECFAPEPVLMYSAEWPHTFRIDLASLESIRQNFSFTVEPPVNKADISVWLKRDDPVSGMTHEEWKILGTLSLKASGLRTHWEGELTQRVPLGSYLMKLSMAGSGASQMSFTQTTPVVVVRSRYDTVDLLQQILREELQNPKR